MTWTLIERPTWRIVFFGEITFGWPVVTRNFYGGGSTVLTFLNCWVEWHYQSPDVPR